ncbi:hypothetical protein P154DRAFT_556664 [Amniculicola lignicola CBS 123094]|uniref:Alpha/beta-hydrolase n=1 Tax=Amniculicola lignicola CBS 123094 TaxID=1392246 RepID=A0A6A5WDK5_9PLEO|nr:hypothetical protein P154DRAFT_556664 [Amniculicola lignicola CBS 123094]
MEPSPCTPTVQTHRQNALAQIHFTSVGDGDLAPSEDETPEEKEFQLEDAQSAIGVSIGQQQTRLTSPKTPAAEKAAALDELEGGGFFDTWSEAQDGTIEQSSPNLGAAEGHSDDSDTPSESRDAALTQNDIALGLPSPWRVGPKKFQRVDDHRSALRDHFATGRPRTMSWGSTTEGLKKYLPFNIPNMPKSSNLLNFSFPSFSASSFDNLRARQTGANDHRKRVTSMYNPSPYGGITQNDGSQYSKSPGSVSRPELLTTNPGTSVHAGRLSRDSQRRPTPHLRRSNSEGSLMVYRTRSLASSLGDDSRFEHVQEQVNSRLKALKDSWQDSNFKLPSMPSLPNFSFGSREDLFRSGRTGSNSPRVLDPDGSARSFFPSSSAKTTSILKPKARDTTMDAAGMSAQTHPHFTKAVQELTGDLVILGGYRGSVLRSAEPPHRQLWVPIKVGLNLRKVDLELGLNPEDEETEEDRIIPAGMLTHIGPVDIAKRLFKRLRASENAKKGSLHVHNYGYDWRLSPHILSRRLITYLESLPCNQPGVPPEKRGAVVVAHSLGGLITRHAINERPDLVAGVVYAGVPQTCVNILGPLRNGDDVLLSSRVLTAQVNFTIRTSFALLPLDGKCFINKHTKEEYPVDFFDPKTWGEYRLTPCIAPVLPAPHAPPPSNLSVSSLLNAMSQALPSLPSRKSSVSLASRPRHNSNSNVHATGSSTPNTNAQTSSSSAAYSSGYSGPVRDVAHNAAEKLKEEGAAQTSFTPQMSNAHHEQAQPGIPTPATTVTIPHDKAVAYLTRTLADIKKWKEELVFKPELAVRNAYPPIALIYGKSTPTVYGAKVDSREAIKRADAYDELAFASGDGVVLARAAMVPEGYSVVRGGVVSSDRGHVTLLGDLEAVGKCLRAVMGARKRGVGTSFRSVNWDSD